MGFNQILSAMFTALVLVNAFTTCSGNLLAAADVRDDVEEGTCQGLDQEQYDGKKAGPNGECAACNFDFYGNSPSCTSNHFSDPDDLCPSECPDDETCKDHDMRVNCLAWDDSTDPSNTWCCQVSVCKELNEECNNHAECCEEAPACQRTDEFVYQCKGDSWEDGCLEWGSACSWNGPECCGWMYCYDVYDYDYSCQNL